MAPISTASAAADPTGTAQVQITSHPDNATVLVDGHERGATPLSLRVVKSTQTLMLLDPAAVDDQRQITVSGDMHVSVGTLWRLAMALQLSTEDPRYSWLNTRLTVWEGQFDEETSSSWYRAYLQGTDK